MAQTLLKWSPVLALHRSGFVCGCWTGAGTLQNYPLTGETGGATLALASPGRRKRCRPLPRTTRKSSSKQGSRSVLLLQPRGRFAVSPRCRHPAPRVTSTSAGDPTQAVQSLGRAMSLSRWPFGFAGDQRWSQPPEQAEQDLQHQGDAALAHVRADVPHHRESRTRASPPR